jgi:putative lipoprotein
MSRDRQPTPRCPRLRRTAGAALLVALTLGPARPARAADPDPWLGRDKALHFGASAVIAGGGYAGAALLTPRTPVRLASGASLALAAGVGKEVYDRYSGGDASFRDLTWDVVGTATGLVVSWLVDRYLF